MDFLISEKSVSFLTILLFAVPHVLSISSSELSIRLYEVDERNSVQKILESSPNTDVFVESVKRIRLECTAPFPVQWVYSGNGVPALSSTIRKETDQKFTASAFITSLKESHSGRYECFSTESPKLANAFFFVFVPGPSIFIVADGWTEGKRVINIARNDSTARIPCAVSNPKIPVILERSVVGDVLIAVKPIGNTPAYTFNPNSGFTLDLRQIRNPEGVYVCTAYDKAGKKSIEFDLRFPSGSDSNSGQAAGNPGNSGDGGPRCSTHTDCPPNWSCYTDLVCRDPCIYSIRCGTGAVCKYNDRRPYCECPKDFLGDPMVSCFNTLQGSDPRIPEPPRRQVPEFTTSSPSGTECKVNDHCRRQTHICLNGNCVDACAIKICDRNAYCTTSADRVAKCVCNPGFSTENGRDCLPAKLIQSEPINREQSDAPSDLASRCVHNRDCPLNTVCRSSRPNSQPSCAELCGSRICGENAYCQKEQCTCKSGFSGDPYRFCLQFATEPRKAAIALAPTLSPAQRKGNSDCSTDKECPDHQSCQSFAGHRKCLDACIPTRCPYNTECRVAAHVPVCECPKGFTGSTLIGCTRDVERSEFRKQMDFPENLQLSKAAIEVTTQSATLHPNCSTEDLGCGQNSVCRFVDGDPTCFCAPNFVGQPPKCKQECVFNIECPADKTCVQNRCRSACRNKCGQNARCRVSSGPSRAHICSCREGYQGNAESAAGCYPVRDN